jgi:hypothetical protein
MTRFRSFEAHELGGKQVYSFWKGYTDYSTRTHACKNRRRKTTTQGCHGKGLCYVLHLAKARSPGISGNPYKCCRKATIHCTHTHTHKHTHTIRRWNILVETGTGTGTTTHTERDHEHLDIEEPEVNFYDRKTLTHRTCNETETRSTDDVHNPGTRSTGKEDTTEDDI